MRENKRFVFLMMLTLMLAWFAFSFFCGERIQKSNGLGWDGILYANVALRPFEYIVDVGVTNYHFVRLLPSIIVHYSSHLLGYELSRTIMEPKAVVDAFIVYNVVLILISAILFYKISVHFNWNSSVFVIGFSGMFLNFPILKLSNYYPTLTDISGFMVSLLIIFLYLKGRKKALFFVCFFSCFVWPTIIYMSLFFLIFNVQKNIKSKYMPNNKLNFMSLIMSFSLASAVLYDFYYNGFRLPLHYGITPVNTSFFSISIVCSIVYLFFMLRQFGDFNYFKKNLMPSMDLWGFSLAVVLFVGVKFIVASFSKGTLILTPLLQIKYMGQLMIVNPLVNVVAHISYFGPVVILSLMLWKDVVSVVKQYGPGLLFFLIFSALLSMGSESRQLMASLPLFTIFTCEVLHRRGVTRRFASYMLASSLIVSRFWLNINGNVPWSNVSWKGPYSDFPLQMYFMNHGPWLSNSMYFVFAIAATFLSVWLFFLKRIHVGPMAG